MTPAGVGRGAFRGPPSKKACHAMNRQQLIILVVVILVLLGYRLSRRRRTQSPALSHDPNVFMPLMADRAVQFAKERGKVLDYSPESIKAVDSLLGELHDLRDKQRLSNQDLNAHALHFGAYIGEVIRRKFGGSWATDHPVAGPKSFPVHFLGGESFPIGWCGKRILNGDEDNVWFKYEVVISRRNEPDATSQASDAGPTTQQ